MGYQSVVVISLSGEKQLVKDTLTAYKMSEDEETIKHTWHILDNEIDVVQYYSEWGEKKEGCTLTWKFEWVKFYSDSDRALHRLAEIVENFDNEEGKISLTYRRMGESDDDYEYREWGAGSRLEPVINYIRDIEVDEPVVKGGRLLDKFFNEQTDMVSESSQQGEVK